MTKKAKDILKNTGEFPLIVVHMDTRSTQEEQDVQARRTVLDIQEKKISQSGYHHVAQLSGAKEKVTRKTSGVHGLECKGAVGLLKQQSALASNSCLRNSLHISGGLSEGLERH